MVCSPFIGSMPARRGYDDATVGGLVCVIGLCPLFAFAVPFAATPTIALVLLFGLSFSYTLPLTLSSSALQEVTPDRMRGFASAIYFVSSALIGMTVGPALVSMITDKMLGDRKSTRLNSRP